jgi:predicted DNA-binding transcriptional regulator AlpA
MVNDYLSVPMSVSPFVPMTRQDVAAVLGVSLRTVDNLVSSATMPAPARLGGRVFWHPDIFYAWLDLMLRKTPDSVGDDRPSGDAHGDETETLLALVGSSGEIGLCHHSAVKASVGTSCVQNKGPKGTAVERMRVRQAKKIRVASI